MRAYVRVGSLAHSGIWRASIAPSMDLPHLLAAMKTVLELLGGLTRVWRFDRMRTVLDPATGDLTAMFSAFAKHHGVRAVVCRTRSGNRKGVVEENNHTAGQRWWRALPNEITAEQAQASLETFPARQDRRRRESPTGTTTAAQMRAAERLRPLPSIVITVHRPVGAWGEILGDTTVAAAMLDRILHRSVGVTRDGATYRLRHHATAAEEVGRATTGTKLRQPSPAARGTSPSNSGENR